MHVRAMGCAHEDVGGFYKAHTLLVKQLEWLEKDGCLIPGS